MHPAVAVDYSAVIRMRSVNGRCNNVALCSQRQQRILADALPSLKEDGLLIYSTCSYSREEDEAILDWLISDCDMESVKVEVPAEWGIVETVSDAHNGYGYRFYPDKVKGEGFFMACLRKENRRFHSHQKI